MVQNELICSGHNPNELGPTNTDQPADHVGIFFFQSTFCECPKPIVYLKNQKKKKKKTKSNPTQSLLTKKEKHKTSSRLLFDSFRKNI